MFVNHVAAVRPHVQPQRWYAAAVFGLQGGFFHPFHGFPAQVFAVVFGQAF
ncbi:MAG: hypothetical protein QM303_06370 [Bacillota bacterium]|nr:hypothetical protein [Bacillota bacterium]